MRKRAATVNAEYTRKAKAADAKYNLTPAGTQGPIARRLSEFGPIVPLVFGWFAEIDAEFDTLLSEVAEVGAARHWQDMNAASPMAAKGTMMWALRRKIASLENHVAYGAANRFYISKTVRCSGQSHRDLDGPRRDHL